MPLFAAKNHDEAVLHNLQERNGLRNAAFVGVAETATHVFFADTAALHHLFESPQRQILSPDERSRASTFHFERDRRMFVSCRSMLRILLGQRLGVPPESLEFGYGEFGKPSLTATKIHFNASHAGTWFALAISTSGPLGMDIEHIHPLNDMDSMSRHFFSPAEADLLASIPERERTRSFFQCWTRKEAVIKATGQGVSRPLDSFEVAFGPHTHPALLRLDDQLNPAWPMHSFDVAPEYIAALTSPAAIGEVRTTLLDHASPVFDL